MKSSQGCIGNNSAGRLYSVLADARVALSNQQVAPPVAWLKAAGLHHSNDQQENMRLAAELVMAISREIDPMKDALKAAGIPETLYLPQISHMTNGLQLAQLHTQAPQTAQYLTGEALLVLGWASVVLPDEDVAIEDKAIAELKLKVEELQQALEADGIPPALRRYATQQLESLYRSLQLFRVQGAAPFKQSVRKAVSDAHFDEDHLKAELQAQSDSPPVRTLREKLGGALKTAATVAGEAEKFAKAATYLGGKASDGVTLLLDVVSKV